MDCDDIRKILHDHLEGNNPPEQQALIEEHLRSCEQCRLHAADIRKTIDALQCLDEIEPPAWLTAKVMNKIRSETVKKKGWKEWLFFPLHIKLPLEAFAAILITVAAVFIYKSMGPELKHLEGQPQAPAIRSMPAAPEKEILKPKMQNHDMQPPQRLEEAAKQKDSWAVIESREITTAKEEKPIEQTVPATAPTMPAPSSSFAPSPTLSAPARHAETGKAAGTAAKDETMQRAAPAAPQAKLAAKKAADELATFTVSVKAPDAARKEIETYIARNTGELKTIEQNESRIVVTIKLDPAKSGKFLALLRSLGRIKEDKKDLSAESGFFRLVIEKE